MGEYRQNVAAIIVNEKNQFWVGERADHLAWGFPQGGIDEGESSKEALYREMLEELGTNDFEIIAEYPDWIRYDFPVGMTFRTWTYRGQEQKYFLVKLSSEAVIDINKFDKEFAQYKWVNFEELEHFDFGFKREVYVEVLGYFRSEI